MLSNNNDDNQPEPEKLDLDSKLHHYLSKYGPKTRSQLVKETSHPRSTLYDSLLRLILKGIVKKYSEEMESRSPGRPKIFFEAI